MSNLSDLKVLCRKLTAATPNELPALCPVLVAHVLRCGDVLSVSSEQQGKTKTSEAAVLVHKLKTQVKTLLQGKTAQGRFAGAVLAKAIVDVGGWECLRTAEPWVRSLLTILQKPDPVASKELAVITLTRIYTLLQPYPTLVREFATPTIPAFATACLQLIRSPASSSSSSSLSSSTSTVPMRVVETATRALAALIPLYPTTLRPFAAQTRVAIRGYIAPTSADDSVVVPLSLRHSARQLLVLLHYTAAKNSNADEWRKALDGLIREAHRTADQVFRAVREARDPSSSYEPGPVSCDGEPSGGDSETNDTPESLPAWSGMQSGAERLAGLLETIAEFFHCSSKLPVVVPMGVIAGLVSRISVILPPASSQDAAHDRDMLSALINPSIGRDERDELWALLPGIHTAALELLASMVRRMGGSIVPLVPEILEQAVRMFAANRRVRRVRATTFGLVRDTLPLVGPSLSKMSVDALIGVVRACCHDILESTGHLKPQKKATDDKPALSLTGTNGGANNRSKTTMANADLFLMPGLASATANGAVDTAANANKLAPSHLEAAATLLTAVLSYVPQQHVKKADRALLDRTAILSANKDAMVASVLQPYVDNSGRYFANTVPFLARAYPHDIEMEVLRSNLRTVPHYYGNIFSNTIPGEDDDDDDEESDDEEGAKKTTAGDDEDEPMQEADGADASNGDAQPGGFALPAFTDRSKPAAGDAATTTFQPLTLKRKSDDKDTDAAADGTPKRLDTGKAPAAAAAAAPIPADAGDDSGDESDGSVQLEMVFDVDDESGDEA